MTSTIAHRPLTWGDLLTAAQAAAVSKSKDEPIDETRLIEQVRAILIILEGLSHD